MSCIFCGRIFTSTEPYYNKTSQSGLIEYFITCAEAAELPVILYNVPSRTGVNISPQTCLTLSKQGFDDL